MGNGSVLSLPPFLPVSTMVLFLQSYFHSSLSEMSKNVLDPGTLQRPTHFRSCNTVPTNLRTELPIVYQPLGLPANK